MTRYAVAPFYFPTTVAFVDDNARFLANLSLQLDPQLAFRLFDCPASALQAVNATPRTSHLDEPLFSLYRHSEDFDHTQHVIEVGLGRIHYEAFNADRFARTSVLVVDYDMPEMNGIAFCRRIADPSIKKVLLTGKADESVAVEAFNEGLIDRFVRKHDPDAIRRLGQAIGELQRAYFRRGGCALAATLAVGAQRFLCDSEFARRFDCIRGELGIVEHYLVNAPDGLLMVDVAGRTYLLLVQSEDMLRAQQEIAREQAAPNDLLQQLGRQQVLPYFWKTAGYYAPMYSEDWPAYLHPASEFTGASRYFYSVVEDPAPFAQPSVYSYAAYLDRLDREARLSAAPIKVGSRCCLERDAGRH